MYERAFHLKWHLIARKCEWLRIGQIRALSYKSEAASITVWEAWTWEIGIASHHWIDFTLKVDIFKVLFPSNLINLKPYEKVSDIFPVQFNPTPWQPTFHKLINNNVFTSTWKFHVQLPLSSQSLRIVKREQDLRMLHICCQTLRPGVANGLKNTIHNLTKTWPFTYTYFQHLLPEHGVS